MLCWETLREREREREREGHREIFERPTICDLISLGKKEMVARTPPKQKKIAAPLNPILLRETVKKVATSSLSLGFSFSFSSVWFPRKIAEQEIKKVPGFWIFSFYTVFWAFIINGFEHLSSSVLSLLGFLTLIFSATKQRLTFRFLCS